MLLQMNAGGHRYSLARGMHENFEHEFIRIVFNPLDGTFAVPDATTEKKPEFIPDISEVFGRPTHKTLKEYIERLSQARAVAGGEVTDEEEDRIGNAIERFTGLLRASVPGKQ
ncbi:hypothetical protein [Burkholderia pseudomallei]|uniref:hypothetical protein n=1 Tax=Burkholderia pseudomallei TaxID=28450 RepID=UPI0005DF08D8|nr:hypothetical protein [Burkholderia pseudomallei]CAJ3268801.1 Uncharacterised protein [Burkholderia pseudomallei]CAJ3509579.1 Uncharacterised protein [Burkholderia pseudomallei]CAJ3830803.1 Uncharacterised protein [Burkholderia pseudomallei]CAJ5635924.1 Uncharacterised protein [Burkholderia pseudomallei]CAJ6831087.1 Uncharacterised protein [Burkholderia pseudomallei]